MNVVAINRKASFTFWSPVYNHKDPTIKQVISRPNGSHKRPAVVLSKRSVDKATGYINIQKSLP